MRTLRPVLILVAAVASGGLSGCADDSEPVGPTSPEAGDAAVITWGTTAVLFRSDPGNLRLIRNYLEFLGTDRPVNSDTRILYTLNCDPRTAADLCRLTSEFSALRPFFDMVEGIGTIEFGVMTETARQQYSLVIADFCHGLRTPERRDLLADYIARGGRALVLGDNACFPRTDMSSAKAANIVVTALGVRFLDLDPQDRDSLEVPPTQREGLLDGVVSLDVFRVVPQVTAPPFEPVVQSDLGTLGAVATFAPDAGAR